MHHINTTENPGRGHAQQEGSMRRLKFTEGRVTDKEIQHYSAETRDVVGQVLSTCRAAPSQN
jgi:hypothetical protein